MRINQKLLSGFLAVSLLIIAVGYVGIIIQKRLTTNFREIAGEVLPGTVALVKMDAELYQSLMHATEYVLTGDIKEKKEVEVLIADLTKHMTIHRLLHARHDPTEHAQIIEAKIDTFINFITEYILLKDKGGTEEELRIVKAKLSEMVADIKTSTDPLIEDHLKDSKEVIKITEQNITRARNLILGSSAIILILALALGYFISRLISKPIIKLTEAANEIGKGKLDTRIEIKSKDEIGELADSLNKMTKDLQAITVSRDAFAQEVDERKRAEEALRENTRKTQVAYDQSIIYAQQLNAEISERKQAEEALRESEEKYRTITNTAQDAIVMMDNEGNISYWNPAAERMFGYTEEEAIGKELHILLGPQEYHEAYKKGFKKFQETGQGATVGKTVELSASKKDGTEFPIELSMSSIQIKGKWHATGIIRDITDRKQAEEEKEKLQTQFIQAQKMEAIGTLAGGIAHDFNNLLMGIQGNASLMLLRANPGHPHHERLKNIEQYVQSGAGLSKQLLGLARSGKYEVKPIDINEFIEKTSGMFGRTKKEIRLHRKYQKDIWTVEIDQGQIEQALLNLYVNAWQAMPGEGDLYLQTANVTLDESYMKPFDVKPGKYVKISVTDTGIGMDEKTMARIFEPFFTTKEMGRGTGLGLASAYGIIKNHGGIINAYSEKGKGTTFNIYLPASEKAVPKEENLPEEVLKGTGTLLLVDDEDMIIEVGKEMLSSMGYKVLVAGGGKEAVEVYGKNKEEIDLVILDMIMPDMGGSKAYDRLKEINSKAKVLLSSGYSINDQATEILERGCDGFIQKPFDMKQLFQKIREILNNK